MIPWIGILFCIVGLVWIPLAQGVGRFRYTLGIDHPQWELLFCLLYLLLMATSCCDVLLVDFVHLRVNVGDGLEE
jgi:hypothetical protein